MYVFCDEAWKENRDGKKVGVLAAIAIPRANYNAIDDRVFLLAEKYWGLENARKREIKGKNLLCAYEYSREAKGTTSMKLAFAHELCEEIRAKQFKVFGCVVYSEAEVDLLCEDPESLDRSYFYLIERIHDYLVECGPETVGTLIFDDRGLKQNDRVAKAYRNFLSRSKLGRSFSALSRSPAFAYSANSVGVQLADLVCTVLSRFNTERHKSHRLAQFYGILRNCEWVAAEPDENDYVRRGFKVIGDRREQQEKR